MTSIARLTLFAGIAAVVVSSAAAANAFQLVDPPEVIWSYPVNGQVDVPTNARFWLATRDATAVVSFQGFYATELETEVPSYSLGELDANTQYTVQVSLTSVLDGAYEPVAVAMTFTTGAGPDFEPPLGVNVVQTVFRDRMDVDERCRLSGYGSGSRESALPAGYFEIVTDAPRAALRVVHADFEGDLAGPVTRASAGDCEAPIVHGPSGDGACFFIEAISPANVRQTGVAHCEVGVPGHEDYPRTGSSGCRCTATRDGFPTWAVIAALLGAFMTRARAVRVPAGAASRARRRRSS